MSENVNEMYDGAMDDDKQDLFSPEQKQEAFFVGQGTKHGLIDSKALVDVYRGSDLTYTHVSESPHHGVYVVMVKHGTLGAMTFSVPTFGEWQIDGGYLPFRESFGIPFDTVEIDNPGGCEFIVARFA